MKLINELLKVTTQEIEDVRKIYNKNKMDVQMDIEILKEWMLKQPHLPQNYDESRLERMLLRSKFRIEVCKLKIESYFTLRGMYPEFFQNQEFSAKGFDQIRKAVMFVPIPHINDMKERIIMVKFIPECDALFDVRLYFEYVLALMDLEFSHEYAVSTRIILDYSNFTMTHVKSIELSATIKGFILYQSAYCAKVSGIDCINTTKYFALILPILKLAIKPKMFAKITIHKDLDSLYQRVNKKYLPSSYGGDQKSIEELHEMMGDMWKQEIEFLTANAKLVSNEKLRIGEPYKNYYFGLDGTFKKLNLD